MNRPDIAIRQLFAEYKISAKRRGYAFNIDFEIFSKTVVRKCYICKTKASKKRWSSRRTHFAVVNGLDRLDSELGYEAGNIKPCCSKCNYMKKSLSFKEFKNHIIKIIAGLV